MEFTDAERDKLLNFLGYGNLNAPYWFLGMEEGTGGIKDVTLAIETHLRFTSDVMDLHVAHDSQHLKWEICEHRNQYPMCWLVMAKLVRALQNQADWQHTEKAKDYVCAALGRENAETFLCELLPLPKPSANKFPLEYASLYKSLKHYWTSVIPYRQERLKQAITRYKPQYLFCYGKSHYHYYKGVVDAASDSWHNLPNTQIEVAKYAATTVVLTPFWGNGAISNRALEALIAYLSR